MSFNSLVSDSANDLNNNPEKKADLVNFPTKLDFEHSKTIFGLRHVRTFQGVCERD